MMPPIGQLNNSIAGLGSPCPSGVHLICNKAICISDSVSMHFDGILYKFDAYFYQSTTLVIVSQ